MQEGDTVRSIAEKFSVSTETIMWANDLPHPDLIHVGQVLQVPPVSGVLYRSQGTESLRAVAERYHADPLEVAAYNGLAIGPDDTLPPGDVIIPNGRRDDYVIADPPSTDQEVAAGDQGATVQALGESQALPEQAPEPERKKPVPIEYTVQEGDTLQSLALLFGVDIETLLNANNIPNPDLVTVGTKLTVLPVSGIQYTVEEGETLADIAWKYEVDGGAIADVNGISNPDLIRAGEVLIIPGVKSLTPVRQPQPSPSEEPSQEASGEAAPAQPEPQVEAPPAESEAVAAEPPKEAPAVAAEPPASVQGGGSAIVENAMAHLGAAYVWGGVGPRGFDCSGFVYYVHRVSGRPVSRGLWGQLNGGPRISIDELQPGDTVFFANTYKAGLSHAGIYIGGGRFIHASDPSTGVTISSLGSPYWSSRYVGASRLW